MVTDRGTADGNEDRVGKDSDKPINSLLLPSVIWSALPFRD